MWNIILHDGIQRFSPYKQATNVTNKSLGYHNDNYITYPSDNVYIQDLHISFFFFNNKE